MPQEGSNTDVSRKGRFKVVTSRHFTVQERRRHERVARPAITVSFDGETYRTESWSLGGFLIEGYDGRLSPGALLTVDALGTLDGALEPVVVRSRVVRADPESGRLVVSFLDVDDRAYHVLQDFMSERMRLLRDQPSSA